MKKLLFTALFYLPVSFLGAQIHDSLSLNNSISVPVPEQKQTNKKDVGTITVSTDLLQYILLQPNINIEYCWNRMAIGIYGGIIQPDLVFQVNPLANGQYTMPGTVYSGEAFKAYFKYYGKKRANTYWCLQLECKPERYNNVSFMDILNNGQEYPYQAMYDNYTINEKTTVWGIDLLHGHQIDLLNIIRFDLFYGFGVHDRVRNYNVTSSTLTYSNQWGSGPYNYSYPGYLIPGTYIGYVCYFTPVVGIRVGLFNSIKKTIAE